MRLKKKMIITAAALLLTALQGVCAMAAQPDASVMNERIYVRGQLTGSEFSYGDSLTVLLQNESDNSIIFDIIRPLEHLRQEMNEYALNWRKKT